MARCHTYHLHFFKIGRLSCLSKHDMRVSEVTSSEETAAQIHQRDCHSSTGKGVLIVACIILFQKKTLLFLYS